MLREEVRQTKGFFKGAIIERDNGLGVEWWSGCWSLRQRWGRGILVTGTRGRPISGLSYEARENCISPSTVQGFHNLCPIPTDLPLYLRKRRHGPLRSCTALHGNHLWQLADKGSTLLSRTGERSLTLLVGPLSRVLGMDTQSYRRPRCIHGRIFERARC